MLFKDGVSDVKNSPLALSGLMRRPEFSLLKLIDGIVPMGKLYFSVGLPIVLSLGGTTPYLRKVLRSFYSF